jgi:class 3 adenylate cyclase/tetratricopeptide (TPR) repeat protein
LGKHFTGQADYSDYNECAVEIAKSAGYNKAQPVSRVYKKPLDLHQVSIAIPCLLCYPKPAPQSSTALIFKAEGVRMKCPACQTRNPNHQKFCGECGAKLETACPNCGGGNPPAYKFCGQCGQGLSLAPQPSAAELTFDEKLAKIQRYLPKGLTEKILSQRDRIEGEHKHVTVIFCDMAGFTGFTEVLGPEEAYAIMDQVYEILIHKVHDYEGTVNEMTGDGIMALFGAPIALEDAPQRAIRSACAIHRELTRFNDKIRQERKVIPPIRMRIGIHTGPVVVGTLGNDLRVEFKAVGETVNLASRVEGFEALVERQIRGIQKPIRIYRVIAPSTRRTRFDVSAERGLTPFVGRERELELLLDGFERVKSGRGQAFSIMGEAGLGKSRLLYEFRKATTNEDLTFLEGKCLSYSRGVAYHPVTDILKSNFDIRDEDDDPQIRKKVGRGLKVLAVDEAATLPYLLELLSVTGSGIDEIPMSPEARRDRIIEAVRRITLKGSLIRPLILAFEDLHWLDKSSEESLKDLLENISGARIFLIFTYRPEFVHTWGGRSYHSQITLNRFSNRESLALVSHILKTEAMDQDLEQLILEKTEGVPFFIEEFVRSLLEQKSIEKRKDRYHLLKDIEGVMVPSTVQEVITARIDTLAEGAKDVLQAGAVVGREFSQDLIQVITGFSEQDLLSNLSRLKNAELLYESGIYPHSSYIFRHALTQEVAYSSLLHKKRKEMHAKIGSAIESLYRQRLDEFYEILAHHYSKSNDFEKAYRYLKLSGNKAIKNYSNWEAFDFYKQALQALYQLPETQDNKRNQIEVIFLMTGPMLFLGSPEDSIRILEEGVRLCKDVGDQKNLAIIYSLVGLYYMHRGKPLKAIKYAEKGYAVPRKRQDIELMAPVARGLCVSYLAVGEFVKPGEVAPDVIELIEKTKRESDFFGAPFNSYALICAYYGFSLAMLGHFEKATVTLEKGLRVILELNHLASLGAAETMYGAMCLIKGDGKSAVAHFQRSIRHFDESKTVLIFAVAWSGLGSGHYYLGDPETARTHIEKGLDLARRGGSDWWKSFHYLYLGKTLFAQGDFKRSRSAIEEAIRISQTNSEKHFEGTSWTWLGRILGKTDPAQRDQAAECMLKGIRILDELKIKPWCSEGHLYLGQHYAETGNLQEARNHLKKAESAFREMGLEYWLQRTREVMALLQRI